MYATAAAAAPDKRQRTQEPTRGTYTGNLVISGRHTCGHKVCIDKKKKAHTKGYVGRQNLLLHIRNMHDGDEEASGFERKKAKVKNQQESAALVCAFSGPRYFCSCVPRILRRNACYRGWQPIHLDPSREIGYEIDICCSRARFRIL